MSKNYINLKKLNKIINFGFFTSQGGVSKNEYLSLNCGNKNDIKSNITQNINIALKSLGISRKKLKLINQIHSNKI